MLPFLLSSLIASAPPSPTPAPPYRLIETIQLGGSGGWDYLTFDPATHRLYISRGDHVSVLDADSEKVVGEIANTPGIHGIAIDEEVGKGFTSNGRSNTVTVFDLATLAVKGEVKTGDKPDAILYDRASKRVFAFNGHSSDTTAIDPAAGTVAGTVALGGAPEFAVADGKGTVFVNLEDKNEVVALDAVALKVLRRWPLTGCDGPTGLALDPEKRRLFSGCANKTMVVSDADTGAIVASLPIGAGVDGAAYDAGRRLAFSSNGEGTLTVIRETAAGAYEVSQTAQTAPGARTLALDPKSHRLYLPTARFGPAPPPSAERPHPRGEMVPGSFVILVVGD
jgi:YVTN family beta-propeller protein